MRQLSEDWMRWKFRIKANIRCDKIEQKYCQHINTDTSTPPLSYNQLSSWVQLVANIAVESMNSATDTSVTSNPFHNCIVAQELSVYWLHKNTWCQTLDVKHWKRYLMQHLVCSAIANIEQRLSRGKDQFKTSCYLQTWSRHYHIDACLCTPSTKAFGKVLGKFLYRDYLEVDFNPYIFLFIHLFYSELFPGLLLTIISYLLL